MFRFNREARRRRLDAIEKAHLQSTLVTVLYKAIPACAWRNWTAEGSVLETGNRLGTSALQRRCSHYTGLIVTETCVVSLCVTTMADRAWSCRK